MENFTCRTNIACVYGLDVAVFVHNIVYWVEKNAANGKNFMDGRYWTHNSMDAYARLYPMWSKDQVKRIINKCRENDLLVVGEYNDNPYLRTKWYSPSDKLLRLYGIEVSDDGIWRNRHIEDDETAKCTYGEIANSIKEQENTQENKPYSPLQGQAQKSVKKGPRTDPDWLLFEAFWAAYPRKTNKDRARRAWRKLSPTPELCQTMAVALERDKRSRQWIKDGGDFIPYPASWLNAKPWEDDPSPSSPDQPLRGEGVRYL